MRIMRARLPGIAATLAGQVARFVALVRKEDLEKKPGVAETLDWAAVAGRDRRRQDEAASETVHRR